MNGIMNLQGNFGGQQSVYAGLNGAGAPITQTSVFAPTYAPQFQFAPQIQYAPQMQYAPSYTQQSPINTNFYLAPGSQLNYSPITQNNYAPGNSLSYAPTNNIGYPQQQQYQQPNYNSVMQLMSQFQGLLGTLANRFQQQPQYPIQQQQPQYPIQQPSPYMPAPRPQVQYNTNINNTWLNTINKAFSGQFGVEANKTARAWGDPHIEGANGKKFEFQELGTYNLLKDSNLNVNAQTAKWNNGTTVISDVGIKAGNDLVKISNGGIVNLNGENVTVNDGQSLQLIDGRQIKRTGNAYELNSNEYILKVLDNGSHLDVNTTSKDVGVLSDGVAPTGILGETFDSTNTKSGLVNDLGTYQRGNLFDGGRPIDNTTTRFYQNINQSVVI